METVTVAAHQKNNRGYARNRSRVLTKFASLDSNDFQGINCRAFESGAGSLPNRFQSFSKRKVVAKNTTFSPKTPSPTPFASEHVSKCSTRFVKSSPVCIPLKIGLENEGDFCSSERWAGPAYSNSPPPSSLPIPKFSVRPKRTVSLELPGSSPEVDLHPISKSAPTSPGRERSSFPCDLSNRGDAVTKTFSYCGVFDSDDYATKTLRRILNLEINDD